MVSAAGEPIQASAIAHAQMGGATLRDWLLASWRGNGFELLVHQPIAQTDPNRQWWEGWCGPIFQTPPEWDTLTAKEHAEAHIREAVGRVRGREDGEWLFAAYRDSLRRSDAQELQRTIAALHAIYNLLMPPTLFTSMDGSHNDVPPSIQSIRLARQIAGRRRVEPPEEPPASEEVDTLAGLPEEGSEVPETTLADMTRVSTTRADNGGGYTHRRRLAHWALMRDRENAAAGGGGLRTLCGTFLTTGRIQTASAGYPDCGRCLRGLRTHYGIVPSGIVTAGAGTP